MVPTAVIGAQANVPGSWEPTKDEAEVTLSVLLISGRRMLTAVGDTSTVAAQVLTDNPLTPELVAQLAVIC